MKQYVPLPCAFLFGALVSGHAAAQSSILGPDRRVEVAKDDRDWNIIIGGGANYGPAYDGSKKSEVNPAIFADVVWKNRFFFSGDSLGVFAVNTPENQLGASVGLYNGRDEKDDPVGLRGLGSVTGGTTLSVFGTTSLANTDFSLSLRHTFGEDAKAALNEISSSGSDLNFSLTRSWRFENRVTLIGQIDLAAADADYLQARYGVNSRQAAASGLRIFKPKAGLERAGVSVRALYGLNEQWFVGGQVEVYQLLGDAAKSPITRKDTQASGQIILARKF